MAQNNNGFQPLKQKARLDALYGQALLGPDWIVTEDEDVGDLMEVESICGVNPGTLERAA